MKAKFISACLIGLILLAGCNSVEPNKKKIMTITDVKKAFANTGTELIQVKEPIKKELWINEVKPTVFRFDPYFDDRLFVYIFKSSEERVKGRESLIKDFSPYQEYLNKNIKFPHDFGTKNVLLVQTNKEVPMRNIQKMQNVLVNELNEGKIIKFEGQGKYWGATYQYNFYDNSENESTDSYCLDESTIYYIAENPEGIGRINYKLESPTHGHYGNDAIVPKDGKLYFPCSGGHGSLDQEKLNKQPIKLYVKWQDKEESIELKPII